MTSEGQKDVDRAKADRPAKRPPKRQRVRGLRLRPKVVVRDYSPHVSARTNGEAGISAIVLHDTESHNRKGASDLAAIGAVFHEREASAHVCTDADGFSGRYVKDADKAWHVGAYNSATLGIEQIGFATDGRASWRHRRHQLRETARWIAHWSLKYGIPIRKGAASAGQITKPGVVTHGSLGALGGGHWDPGDYPIGFVLWLARGFKAARLFTRNRKEA